MQPGIDCSLVHKSAQEAVLLCSAERRSDGSWDLGVDLPRRVSEEPSGAGELALVDAEIMRQAAIAFAHLECAVPRDWAFLMQGLNFGWVPNLSAQTLSPRLRGLVRIRSHALGMRKGQVRDLQLEADFISDGVIVGSGYGDLTCIPAQTYRALRRNAPAVSQEDTGPLGAVLADVQRGGDGLWARLVWNWQDSLVFDHFSDHIPGMLSGSAVLAAHRILTGAGARRISLRFENFGEYGAPVQVTARLRSSGRTVTTVTQDERHIATGLCFGVDAADTPEFSAPPFTRSLTPAG